MRELQHQVIDGLNHAIDLAAQRAYEVHLAGGDGVTAREAMTLGVKVLDAAQSLRARALECELGVWR